MWVQTAESQTGTETSPSVEMDAFHQPCQIGEGGDWKDGERGREGWEGGRGEREVGDWKDE